MMLDSELGELTKGQQEAVQLIQRQAQVLNRQVEDIALTWRAGARPLKMDMMALDTVVRTLIEDYDMKAKQLGLCLKAEIAPDLPPIRGAPADLRRALANLLSNAVKFTPAGGTIAVRVAKADHSIIVQVSDTGIGIPRDEQERIFERFYQVNGIPFQRSSGVGLGLALVKEIVEAHEGTITVESAVGSGSVFTVILPIIET